MIDPLEFAARQLPQGDAELMARRKASYRKTANANSTNLGFEQKLWQAADKLRGHMDAAEYKHVVSSS